MDPTNTVSPEIPLSTPEKKDGHWIAILAMALFVAASLVAVGFLYYQNQQLKTMLAGYQIQESPTPVATIKTYSTPKPNGDLQTFSRSSCGNFQGNIPFSIDIPAGWKEDINDSKDNFYSTYTYSNEATTFSVTCGTGFGGGGCGLESKEIQNQFTVNGQKISGCMEQDESAIELRLTYLKIGQNADFPDFSFTANTKDLTNGKNLINQILSSFKYSGPTPSPDAKACTLEAKLCPDGSSVGRTGPNCEFAACP